MKITLIKPGIGTLITGYNLNEGSMEPLSLAIIAGLIEPPDEVLFYDDRIESIPFDEPTDLVCITVDTFNARRAYEIASGYRARGVKVVLGGMHEIEKDKLKTILFVDDNMILNPKELKLLLRELIPMKVKWFNKSPNIRDFNNYKEALEIFRDYGFLTWASFMIGNDFDTIDTIKETVEFAIKNKFTLAFFHILMPYPETKIYRQFQKENRLLYDEKWWTHPDYRYNQAAFIPKLITPEQLSEATIKANKDFYSVSSITQRLFDTKTNLRNLVNLAVYSRFNYVLRKTSV